MNRKTARPRACYSLLGGVAVSYRIKCAMSYIGWYSMSHRYICRLEAVVQYMYTVSQKKHAAKLLFIYLHQMLTDFKTLSLAHSVVNLPIYGQDMDKSMVACFLTHGVYYSKQTIAQSPRHAPFQQTSRVAGTDSSLRLLDFRLSTSESPTSEYLHPMRTIHTSCQSFAVNHYLLHRRLNSSARVSL